VGAEVLQAKMDIEAERRRAVAPAPCCAGATQSLVHTRSVRPATLLGPIRLRVRTFRCGGCGQISRPDDAALGVPQSGHFCDDVRELLAPLSAELPDRTAADLLERTTGLSVSPRGVQGVVRTVAADLRRDREAREVLEEQAVTAALERAGDEEAPALGIELAMDGVMTHVDGVWREAKVATLLVREVGPAAEVVDPEKRRGRVLARRYTCVLGDPEALAERVLELIREAHWEGVPVVEVLGDGAPWIWNLARNHFPHARQTLDWWHLAEHFHVFARVRCSDQSAAKRWVRGKMDALLEDRVGDVLGGLRRMRARSDAERTALADLVRYVENNASRILYEDAWLSGFAIGSGSVEGACKHLVQARFKRAGMRWKTAGFSNVLELRVARLNGTLDGFHKRAAQRARRAA